MPAHITAIFYGADKLEGEQIEAIESIEHCLFDSLGLSAPYPFAQYIAGETDNEQLCLLSFLSLEVGSNQVSFIAGGSELQLSDVEHQALQKDLLPWLQQSGFQFIAQKQSQWLLQTPFINNAAPWYALKSESFWQCLPKGDKQSEWQRLYTEGQMLLSTSTLNIERQSQNKPQINALWFWGQGKVQAGTEPKYLLTDCPILQKQLASVAAIEVITIKQLLALSAKQLTQPLIIYLEKQSSEIEKKLQQLSANNEIVRVHHNGRYHQLPTSFINKIRNWWNTKSSPMKEK
jgi:hypothetical protein